MQIKDREEQLLLQFQGVSREELYDRIMELGKGLSPLLDTLKVEENRVVGCQSLMYCAVRLENNELKISLDSDALISKGLGALVYHLYDGLTPKEALTAAPKFFEEAGLFTSLSMTRLNGLQALLRHVLKKAYLLQKSI